MRSTLAPDLEVLRRIPPFAGCSRRQLHRADRFCTFICVQPGRVLSREGEQPDQLVVVVSGRALAVDSSGRSHQLEPGDTFGALASRDERFAVVVAQTSGSVLAVARPELASFLDVCPAVASRLTAHGENRTAGRRLERIAAVLVATQTVRCMS